MYGIGYQPNQNKKLFYDLNLSKKIDFNLADVRNLRKFEKLVKNKTFNNFPFSRATTHIPILQKPFLTFDININGTLNLMEIIRKNSFIKSAVIVTSDKCYESNNSTKGFKGDG